ncbi:MAG: RNA 2',3'-cyclic phosphodiesterase [Candidatus Anammoxibacter sp.]
MVRTFIAIEISDKTRNNLKTIIAKLSEVKAHVKWVLPVNLHITLKFLGNVKDDEIVKISEFIRESSCGIKPFNLHIGGLGAFPDLKRPKVIFVNIKDEYNNLFTLHNKLEEKLTCLGIKKELRKYEPHITIGRVRSRQRIDTLTNTIEMHKNDSLGNEQIESVALMMSELLPKGPEYTKLDTIKL